MSFTIKMQEQQEFTDSKFIKPGISTVKITEMTAMEPEDTTKSSYISVKFETEDGKLADSKFYFSDAARPYS